MKSNPEDDSTYVIRSRSINKVIDNIPRFKYWVQQGNTRLAERRAAEELRIKEEMVARQELEKAREIERIQAIQDKAVREKKEKKGNMVLMFLALIVATISVIVWNKFFRKRCPRCKSLNFDTTDTREVDRFRTAKMVRENNSKGSSTRSVSAMFVKREYDYSCGDCGHKWTELKREEL